MRRIFISSRKLLTLTKQFMKSYNRKHKKKKWGRPYKYPEYYILYLMLIARLHNLSIRDTLRYARGIIPKEIRKDAGRKVPVVSNYWYRMVKMDKEIIEEFMIYVARRYLKKAGEEAYIYAIIDGTGFSYKEIYPMKFYRGEKIKKIKNHVKIVIMAAFNKEWRKGIVIGIKSGRGYSSEIRLAKEMKIGYEGWEYLLGDKAYDDKKWMKRWIEKEKEVLIGIREGIWQKVKDETRKRVKEKVEKSEIYRYRWRIENVNGNVKEKMGRHIRVKNEEIAEKMAMIGYLLYNIYMFCEIQPSYFLLFFIFVIKRSVKREIIRSSI